MAGCAMPAEDAETKVSPLRPAWGPIAFLCVAVVYLIGFAACMVVLLARGGLS